MKRLYVQPSLHIGETLIHQIIALAPEEHYSEMVLDTLQIMQSAIYLYQHFGFQVTSAYYDTPLEDAIYMKLDLHCR